MNNDRTGRKKSLPTESTETIMSRYYISTGAQNNFFTLRQTWQEPVYVRDGYNGNAVRSGYITRDFHVRNLSTDRETAIAKAKEFTDLDLSTDIEVVPIGTPREIDWSILQAGKHAGRSIHELAENAEGRQYLIWLAENCAGNGRYAKTVDLAKAFLVHELESRQAERDEAKQARATLVSKAREVLRPIIEVLSAGDDWCQGVAADIGRRPINNTFAFYVIDNFAKNYGRRNSKAYFAARDKARDLIDSANELLQ